MFWWIMLALILVIFLLFVRNKVSASTHEGIKMALCTDRALTYLNENGFNVIRLPRKGIGPLDVLGRDGRSLERLGSLNQLWNSRRSIPEVGGAQPVSHINGQKTNEMSLSIGLKFLSSILGAMGAKVPELSTVYNQANSIEFGFGNVMCRSVAPLEIGAYLAEGDLKASNPIIERYLIDDDTEAFVISETLESNEITVSAKNSKGDTIAVAAPLIQNVIGGDISVALKASGAPGLTYAGKEMITFGFKAFAIAFDGRWHVKGVSPSANMAFSPDQAPSLDPIILRQGRLMLK
jgi:hypothetical protein